LAPIERVFVEQLGARIGCGCLRFGLWRRYVVRVQIVARAPSALRVCSERCVPGMVSPLVTVMPCVPSRAAVAVDHLGQNGRS
jgi:hypothetical protein